MSSKLHGAYADTVAGQGVRFGRKTLSVPSDGDVAAKMNVSQAALWALIAAILEISLLCASQGNAATSIAPRSEIAAYLGDLGGVALCYVLGRDVATFLNRERRARLTVKRHDRLPLAQGEVRAVLKRLEMKFYLFTRSR